MKLSAITLFLAATIGLVATAAAQPAAASGRSSVPKTLQVVMHDPGCHWFMVGGKYRTSAKLTGRVRLLNMDEATLKATSSKGTERIPVGHSIVLGHGRYVITMVGQAPDDNHLRLTVR